MSYIYNVSHTCSRVEIFILLLLFHRKPLESYFSSQKESSGW